MLLAHRAFTPLTPEDQRIKKQWARCVAGFYAVIAIGLLGLAFAAPSAEPHNIAAKHSGTQVFARN
jgi:hypothetical protein